MYFNRIENGFILIVFMIFTSCATKGIHIQRENNQLLRTFVHAQKLDKAKELLKSEKYYPEERSKLVKLLNTASLAYLMKDYAPALEFYRQALSLSDELYTTSIKAKATTLVTNDNLDLYYGENYERSYIRFYVALCNYHLYQKEADSKIASQYLRNARASILDWDTFLTQIQYELAGRPTYKNDLSAKIFGALIHEEIGSSGDLQIAKQLYKDAEQVLLRQYNSYPTFNGKWKEYVDDYKKLPSLSEQKLKESYLAPTAAQNNLVKFIEERQANLGKKTSKQKVILLIQNNLIEAKGPEKLKYPLTVNFAMTAAVGGNSSILSPIQFATSLLGVSKSLQPEIGFEYPMVPLKPAPAEMNIKVLATLGGETLVRPAMIAPLSELAHQETENGKIKNMAKAGARLAAKHLTTMAGLYATYQLGAKQGGIAASLALPAAMGSYALASRQIAQSELADLREWTLLPSTIQLQVLDLAPGQYRVMLNEQEISNFKVVKSEKSQMIDIFLP